MGILDDAIREHLELKRKHGVAEDELQRQEEEALGPARREVARQRDNGEPGAAETGAEDEATANADEAPASLGEAARPAQDQETVLFDMEEAAAEPTSGETPKVEEALPGGDEDAYEPGEDDGFEREEELGPDDELEEDEELEPDDDELLSPEEESAAEAGDQDVLEDTPDFLQETPEHDRLWFEQKPPRDFDFD